MIVFTRNCWELVAVRLARLRYVDIIPQRVAGTWPAGLAKQPVEALVAVGLVALLLEGSLVQLLQTKAEKIKFNCVA